MVHDRGMAAAETLENADRRWAWRGLAAAAVLVTAFVLGIAMSASSTPQVSIPKVIDIGTTSTPTSLPVSTSSPSSTIVVTQRPVVTEIQGQTATTLPPPPATTTAPPPSTTTTEDPATTTTEHVDH